MKNKRKYTPEMKGVLLSTLILIILAASVRLPEWLPANNAWLAALVGVAVVVITFVIIMYKTVSRLKTKINK